MPAAQVNGATLRYEREGAGEPVILLHGYLFGADWWRPQIDALRDRFDCVAVDLRGQMGSETTEEPEAYDLWNQARDIAELMDRLDLQGAHVVGLSMGGMIGMRLALAQPERARSLVLMDTSAAAEDAEKVERYEAMLQVVESGALESVLPALPPIFLADGFVHGSPETVDHWLGAVRQADPRGLVMALRAINRRDDISARVGEIAVPTLVIHGTEDVAIPLSRAEELAHLIPGARLETVSGGHQSNVDRAHDTSRLIREFLVSVSSTAAAGV